MTRKRKSDRKRPAKPVQAPQAEVHPPADEPKDSRTAWGGRPPGQPTDAAPGSEEKVEVMRRRLEAGESLWNDAGDAKMDDPHDPPTFLPFAQDDESNDNQEENP